MTTFRIQAQEQKTFNRSTGEWEIQKPYNPDKPIWGVTIKHGQGETDDIKVAIEFADMGYLVTPDPKEAWRELHANDPQPQADADAEELTEDEQELIAAYRKQKAEAKGAKPKAARKSRAKAKAAVG